MKKILYVVNSPEFFLSHRLPLAIAARNSGYQVYVASADGNGVAKIRNLGFEHFVLPLARSGQNPIKEMRAIVSVYRLFRKLIPDLVHLVTIKPVIYGGIAARFSAVKGVVAAVSGLGTVFTSETLLAKARRAIVANLYRIALSRENLVVIFQNPSDRDILLELRALCSHQVRMIRGSGVSLIDYPFIPEPECTPVVVMASRLLRDKGVHEFLLAAQLLKIRGVSVRMRLIGSVDPDNPTSLSEEELAQWERKNVAELLGYRSDIARQYAEASIVCLPSYREGLPKGLLEAAACGRPVITTDVPGCRDAIIPEESGVLVPVKDAAALADAIQQLIEDPQRRQSMGKAGRKLAEEAFAVEKIVAQHLKIYDEVSCSGKD